MATTRTRPARGAALVLGVVGGVAALVVGSATLVAADQTIEFGLKNTTGQDAKDLHLTFNTSIRSLVQDPAGTFSSVEGVGKNKLDLKGGTVAPGETLKLKVTGDSSKTKLNNWYWTDGNGRKLSGGANPGCREPDCTVVDPTTTTTTSTTTSTSSTTTTLPPGPTTTAPPTTEPPPGTPPPTPTTSPPTTQPPTTTPPPEPPPAP